MTVKYVDITYLKGDATRPIDLHVGNKNTKNILHVCNDKGGWGRGFVNAISKRWPEPELFYRSKKKHELGQVTPIEVQSNIRVFNMIAQHGYLSADNPKPLDLQALQHCLSRAAELISFSDGSQSVHMPRIGCGLAGSNWNVVVELVEAAFSGLDIPVYVYDLPGGK